MEKSKIESVRQLPVMPLTIEDMTWNKTGMWRLLTPVVAHKAAPCMGGCPIHQHIPQFIQAVLERDWEKALVKLLEVNPLPGVTGRLCYHPCQTVCARRDLDRGVSIKDLERMTAEKGGLPVVKRQPASGFEVAVCGSGPAGLSAAYHLALQGHLVTILEPSAYPGGFLKDLSEDKLPPEVLAMEISRLIAVGGVKMETNAAKGRDGNYDLVLLDRTAHPVGSASSQAVEDMAGTTYRPIHIGPKERIANFKSVQVAEAVALGYRVSKEAGLLLGVTIEESWLSSIVAQKGELNYHRLPDQKTKDMVKNAKGSVDEEAVTEAARCLSCGICNLCQSCVLACPDACCRLDEKEDRIVIDLYHCKGCGICSYECPRGVLTMENLP